MKKYFLHISLLALSLLTPAFVGAATYPPDGQYSPVAVPNIPRPGYLVPITDPAFGTKITRITDDAVFGQSNVRHGYSKDQPWNYDQTLIKIGNRILDGKTYKILRTISMPGEPKWSSTDPNKIFGVSGNRFVSVNAATGARQTLHTFSGYSNIQLGPWEGNLSIGDKYAAFLANGNTIIVYDIANDAVISTKTLASLGHGSSIDWVSMSQSGNYVVISGIGSGRFAASYDRNLNRIATLLPRHSDLGYDASGNEVLVTVCNTGTQMFRLDNGQKTSNLVAGTAGSQCGHVSTRNYKRPGWAYVSYSGTSKDMDVMAVKLDSSQTVERFTHHRSSAATYRAQPHGVVSPDGTRVMFASDWNGTAPINSYIAEMPNADAGPPPAGPPPPSGPHVVLTITPACFAPANSPSPLSPSPTPSPTPTPTPTPSPSPSPSPTPAPSPTPTPTPTPTPSPTPSPPTQVGNDPTKLDITFIGHGFTTSQLGTFHNDVNRFKAYLLTFEPFKSRASQINFRYVDNTADLKCGHDPVFSGIERFISCDLTTVTREMNNSGVPYDKIAVIINTPVFGGGGNSNFSTAFNGSGSEKVFVHEFGHSFGNLRDEYVTFDPNTKGAVDGKIRYNCYGGTPPSAEWTALGVPVEYHLGCTFSNWYRSSPKSIMRDQDTSVEGFNAVSRVFINREIDYFTATNIPRADLVVTSVSYQNGTFTARVKNQGTAATREGKNVVVGFSVDGTYRTSGAENPIAPGNSGVITTTTSNSYTIPSGTHTITARVDNGNLTAESDESNNALTQTITVGGSATAQTPTLANFSSLFDSMKKNLASVFFFWK